ncbi:protein NO VEIN-like [Actinidia eriantha]|uniref:protein NO VEIN-like n=1 Tax=Actinidia eriantha TaxID=165200 RepID=UPI0025830459|nr:protein NO VEIN-like [Actinidia eriantha]
MAGQRPRFPRGGGGRGRAPNYPHPQNPNIYPPNQTPMAANHFIQNPNNLFQNPNLRYQNPNFPIQVPNFPPHQFPNQSFRPQPRPPPPGGEALERIELAFAKARRDLLAAGVSVSAWKLIQSALLNLQTESWDSLGVQMQQVPSLHRLLMTEGKINAFIHCFVAVQRITSLYDLEVAICKNEGVEQFEELELGPLVRHPLVVHYFSVSSDVTEVFKITTEEIISCLCEFMDTHKGKEIDAKEFLDFIAKKRSVTSREKLSVRIQSLGLHLSHIHQAKRSENSALKILNELRRKSEKRSTKRPLFMPHKKQLDDHFRSISQSVKSFSSLHGDFGGKHAKFGSSCSEDEDSDDYEPVGNKNDVDAKIDCKLLSGNNNSCDRVSSCPYPSAAEEMSRLGLKGEIDANPSAASGSGSYNESNGLLKKKRKSENLSSNIAAPRKLPRKDTIGSDLLTEDERKEFIALNEADLLLPKSSMRMFLATWKEACRENNVAEVFERMFQFYKTPARERLERKAMLAELRQRKKMISMFSSYPCIGLLNVAIASIKSGMWDSMYDTFQAFTEHEVAHPLPEKSPKYENIEVEPPERDALILAEDVSTCKQSISVEDVVHEVSTFFEPDYNILSNINSSLEKKFTLMRKLRECEIWMTKQFSIKEFESLGYGDFFTFLEKYVSLLPNALQKCLTGHTYAKSPLEVCMRQHQLTVLLSQASKNLVGNDKLTKERISMLLMRQFPPVSFILGESGSLKDFMNNVRTNESTSTCVLFSITLLGSHMGDTNNGATLCKTAAEGMEIFHKTGTLGSFTTKDAIDVLLRAPMLADLYSWTHWDVVFAPTFGPLVGWLLNDVNAKELLCLVTKDGKVIRIDHTATVDSFLEAFLQGSSFQTAVKLLSLLSLYGGDRHVPLSLLKSYARQAFEVFMKNFSVVEVNVNQTFLLQRNSLFRQPMSDVDASDVNSDLCKQKSTVHEAVTVAAKFFIDCLCHFPVEFHPFAADILLSGLRSVIKDASSVILGECKLIEHRLMLHYIGLSLGIVEWIDDYHAFSSTMAMDWFAFSGVACLQAVNSEFRRGSTCVQDGVNKSISSKGEMPVSVEVDQQNKQGDMVHYAHNSGAISCDYFRDDCKRHLSEVDKEKEAALVIESIRREEFGLDSRLSETESSMLKKQHARLGRALQCLSQELYSQDSHFLLELVQNADDNVYGENVEPTLSFILQKSGIIVLNNEQGFSAQNIRALCDVGNSTKKGSGAGYIGKKGIGFKSVFRVTDAPEIHSNGFHIKFDISEGQIGFVLPTGLPPCDINLFRRLASSDADNTDAYHWNTCIVLPFRSNLSDVSAMNCIKSMFSDLHPSLLLFLHRLQCIRFRNVLDDSMITMRKEIVGNGIVKVSLGKEKMTWLVESQELQAGTIRPDVKSTEISVAFTLQESDNGDYIPSLDQQPAFAFLPLRRYGLKFIVQGDFVLPSSREEVDGDSPWNQWLLSKIPDLFVAAERSFCALPCFRENPGKAVTAFMSFVPLAGEVHGFFSNLPRLIVSKLRISKCLLMEGDNKEWVLPCKVIRCWNEQAQSLFPDSLLHEHLGLGFLDKDIVLSDSLARDLGIEEYGPKILLRIISSLCHSENGIKSVGLIWLSSWLNALYTMVFNSSGQISLDSASDIINNLKRIPFIPLSDGTYSSEEDGTIWLHADALHTRFDDYDPEVFPVLYARLRTVSPALLSAASTVDISCLDVSIKANLIRMLQRVGVQQVSAHEIVMIHILPAISNEKITIDEEIVMIEYLSFVMLHLQSNCPNCNVERGQIISVLCSKALILTNCGFKRPTEVSIHFSKEFGNPIDVSKFIDGLYLKWHEVDVAYLKHPITESLPGGMMKWREFFQELGITDFVHVVSVEKSSTDISHVVLNGELISRGAVAKDWESPELVQLLSQLSLSGDRIKCKCLLEILDTLWDTCFTDKVTGRWISNSPEGSQIFKSSFICSLCDVRWMVSIMDNELHYAKDLYYDCDAVRSILGATAPYVVPKVKSEKLLFDIGFKTQVNLDDALIVLQVWRRSETPFMASIAQMSRFYTFIWNEMATSKQKIVEELLSGPFIFVPYSCGSRHEDIVAGVFLSPSEVYWSDLTGSVNQIKGMHPHSDSSVIDRPLCKTLSNVYPSLHDFFVSECGVSELPCLRSYLHILLQLSTVALPSQAANMVFQVFLQWSDGLKSGILSLEDIAYLKECLLKLEFAVLPTVLDKWVSLHPSFGLICWCDDEKLRNEFKHVDNVDFLYFGDLSDEEQEILRVKVSVLMQNLGIPALSEAIIREAIYYGAADSNFKASLLNWALPYAQRYIYKVHCDRYFQLKQSGFDNLGHLQIIVVEKLFYRNILKKLGVASKKRFECSCLLLGNVLYTNQESNSHALFMELSRLIFDGTPDLHLANFLHMITTMVESGSNEEQTEFFILSSQKVPKLPKEELVWSLKASAENDETILTSSASPIINEQNPMKSKRKPGITSSWPPVDWKTVPAFPFPRGSTSRARTAVSPPSSSLQVTEGDSKEKIIQTDHVIAVESAADWTIEGDQAATATIELWNSEDSDHLAAPTVDVPYDSVDLVIRSDDPNFRSSKYNEREQLSFGTPNALRAQVTGRLGEGLAFNYFASNAGTTNVKWVNQDSESGLPFDLIIADNEKIKEYVEVKATSSGRKDWFTITVREWQFAVEKGESYSIAHVHLSGNKIARITVFKNPVRLCQLGKLQLAVLMPKQQQEFSIVS